MKVNTAIGLLLIATALLTETASGASLRNSRFCRFFALAVLILAGATLCEYAFAWDLRIDELLSRDGQHVQSTAGRMSIHTAVALAVCSSVLMLPMRRGLRWTVRVAAALLLALGFSAALGYAWSASELITDYWGPPLALNTAVTFMLLGVGLLLRAAPTAESDGVAVSEGRHVEAKIWMGFALALLLLCVGGGVTYRMQVHFVGAAEKLDNSRDLLLSLDDVYVSLANAVNVQRYYLLLGHAQDREDYVHLASVARQALQAMPLGASDTASSAENLRAIQSLGNHRLDDLSAQVATFDRSGPAVVRDLIESSDGRATMQRIRATLAQFKDAQNKRMDRTAVEFVHGRARTLISILVLLLAATSILLILLISIVRDVRTRARMLRELGIAQREAQVAVRAKSDFLASMSHEIRTPMNGVLGMLDLLENGGLNPRQVDSIKIIRESADSLLTIIDDILDFSKLETGNLAIEYLPMSIAHTVESVCSLINCLAERRGVSLRVFCDPEIPFQAMGDATRVTQVLVNLVSNAVKFSSGLERRGRIQVRALLAERTASRIVLELRVDDNGIGMDSAVLKRLFTSFMQADASITRRYGGTGLGLAISRQLVTLMEGSIDVESTVGVGSRFMVRLPFDTVVAGAPELTTADGPTAGVLNGATCRIVGLDADFVDDLACYLRADGAVVRQDYRASGGIEVSAESVGTDLPSEELLIVVLGEDQPPPASITAGRTLWVTSGRHPPESLSGNPLAYWVDGNALPRVALRRAASIALGRADAVPEAVSRAHQSANAPPPPIDRAEAIRSGRLILVAEDHELNRKVILGQLAMLGYAADAVPSGAQALECWRSGHYALLLTDLHMPELDGYALTAAIRVEERGRTRIPIVALTANVLHGEAERCRDAGMDDYLSKPATLDNLARAIDRWLPRLAPAPAPAPAPALDLHALQVLVGDDPAFVRELIEVFDTSVREMHKEIAEACRNGQATVVAASAHKLKSAARSVGAARLADVCGLLEAAGNNQTPESLMSLLPEFEAAVAGVFEFLQSPQNGRLPTVAPNRATPLEVAQSPSVRVLTANNSR